MADNWIKDAIKDLVLLQRKQRKGMDVKEFASKVTANPDKYDTRQFAKLT